jgi:hypothetical protein
MHRDEVGVATMGRLVLPYPHCCCRASTVWITPYSTRLMSALLSEASKEQHCPLEHEVVGFGRVSTDV